MDYALVPDGVAVLGTGLVVSFGRAQAGAIPSLEKLAGPVVSRADRPGCGLVLRHADGSVAIYREEVFRGWVSPDGRSGGLTCAN